MKKENCNDSKIIEDAIYSEVSKYPMTIRSIVNLLIAKYPELSETYINDVIRRMEISDSVMVFPSSGLLWVETVNHREAIDYLTIREGLNELGFDDHEITVALDNANIGIKELTIEKGFASIPTYMKVFEVLKGNYLYIGKNRFGGPKNMTGVLVRVPDDHQSVRHGKIIFELMKNRYPWFSSFRGTEKARISEICDWTRIKDIPEEFDMMTVSQLKDAAKAKESEREVSLWKIYGLNTYLEIYLKTEFGTLYVPINAILGKNYSLVEKRMENYFTAYYGNDTKRLAEALRPLESRESEALKAYLSN